MKLNDTHEKSYCDKMYMTCGYLKFFFFLEKKNTGSK